MANTPKFNPDLLRRAEQQFRGSIPRHLVDRDEKPVDVNRTPLSIRDSDDPEEWRLFEKAQSLNGLNQHLTPSVLFANPLNIIHPSLPYYGPDHGLHTSQLAVYIAQVEGVRDSRELEALKAAALMHDVGRCEPAGKEDPGHAQRSAELADRFMRSDATGVRLPDMRERVCRLIAAHTLSWRDPPRDPLLRALSDADALEAARFGDSDLGRRYTTERWRKLLSRWTQLPTTQARWRAKYRW